MSVEHLSTAGIRSVTEEEIAHYREKGWAKLPGFFSPETVADLLRRAKSKMGEQAPLTVRRDDADQLEPNEYNWYARWDGCSHEDPRIRDVGQSRALATAASRLMGDQVRFYFDHFFVKVPQAAEGTETPWHQDLPHHPLDRQGVLTIWVPLVECPPEKGSLRFLSGSHRAGLLGRYLNRRDEVQLVDEHPWILDEYEMSPPLHLYPGDATVHNLAITHYAPPNTTDTPRWVYSTQWLPVRTRYTGAPNHRTEGLGLKVDQPLDHPRFPVIETDHR
ncbi:phytanoyl-CoA dioxygenase family protein [Amycolatopsis sp. WGS_07]|uniref:phytanoyl-CoA dioxygenase family protein n=1 Tax=Amycolatopsis sp. WGS_07 TaxID=3076764 RepID=UPI003872A83F